MKCMTETGSLTQPAWRWKQFSSILTVDSALERPNAYVYIWFRHLNDSQSDLSAIPYLVFALVHACFLMAFPDNTHRKCAIKQ